MRCSTSAGGDSLAAVLDARFLTLLRLNVVLGLCHEFRMDQRFWRIDTSSAAADGGNPSSSTASGATHPHHLAGVSLGSSASFLGLSSPTVSHASRRRDNLHAVQRQYSKVDGAAVVVP